MTNEELCMELAKATKEEEVIEILKNAGYWDDPSVWQYYGGIENNFSIIGSQQSSADSALVEKIVNSVDAVLMRECLKMGIDPTSNNAPENIDDALYEFFNIENGNLANLQPKKRLELADNIRIVATGANKNPCYSIIDKGEGQTPKRMTETFLSLVKSNKLKIPFVQGKFNMGGTGTLPFCGEKNIQLIISKRNPEISKNEVDDGTSDLWGFTVIRREEPAENAKSSSYKYLAPKNQILSFNANSLPLLPGKHPEAYVNPLESGTFIKIYEYKLQPTSLKTLINFDLHYRLSLLLPKIALPVLLEEMRNYSGHSLHSVLSGLSVRLEEDKRDNIEDGFPSSHIMNIQGEKMNVHIYAFKKDASVEKYKKKEGIIFTINGQSHGYISKPFFKRKSVKMNYISDSIFVIVDCSNISGGAREKLFMNSRDKLRDGELKKEIEKTLEKIIKEHPGLRALKERRRQENIGEKIKDSKPLEMILENVIKKSPTLSNLLIMGQRITSPFNLTNVGKAEEFIGKEYPTFFDLKKQFTPEKPKHCPSNHRFRIQFQTDADNDYLTRDDFRGEFRLIYKGKEYNHYIISLWDGTANLTCELPEDVNQGDIIEFRVEVDDRTQIDPFENKFYVIVDPPANNDKPGNGKRSKPAGGNGNRQKAPSALNLPNIYPVKTDEWNNHNFDGESALRVEDAGDEGYDFYINMDNVYLLNEIKSRTKIDPKILESQFQYGMVLIGLSLLNQLSSNDKDDERDIEKEISLTTKAIAPMLLPMIISLGELENT
ncbi:MULTISPECIES: hypothetical protein [Methanobacterium]|uniref:Uncharacterized protein n=1 Tax=Methanobacterium veterum TaxID=408577 RepID=A0A9E5A367_9EURY|nr:MULTISPECIES: hypothetical protein [Methanobacterium]MCZ3366535.1 hypothetical protein [Methanobacterium veterum]MCZ3371756.1 hypothetical protein [Methanobacterium veterum]